ncbi:MAG: hypothetical protein WDN06_18365 [Asticcacaulis sp.]
MAWSQANSGDSLPAYELVVQIYDSAGAKVGGEILVDASDNRQSDFKITASGSDGFIVTWSGTGPGGGTDAYMEQFSQTQSGGALGGNFTTGRYLDGSDNGETLTGGSGNDTLIGHGGNDILNAAEGKDALYGGAGDDLISLNGRNGSHVDGGAGFDTVDYSSGFYGVTINLKDGTATHEGFGTDILTGIEKAIGTGGSDILTGSDNNDVLDGGGGGDNF